MIKGALTRTHHAKALADTPHHDAIAAEKCQLQGKSSQDPVKQAVLCRIAETCQTI